MQGRTIRPATLLFLTLLLGRAAIGQTVAPALLQPDARYKADVLLVVAHPDDDVVIGGYLARISLDERKRVAVVYCTNGDGGGNNVGFEAGAALGQMRDLEARRALASLGIENVWFLKGHDTPGQNVLRSLDSWNHGLALDEVVRLVRITRPEVIVTWLPDYVVGENHDDHQASGVLATEAFDAAGDPTVFPEQVSPPRDRTGMANLTEGLQPWQPKKLYFFSDAFEDFGPYWHDAAEASPFRKNMMDGRGPSYATTDLSPTRHESYARLTAEQQAFYLTQEGALGVDALKTGKLADWEYPVRLIFGKSVVGGSVTGDLFDGITAGPAPFARARGYEAEAAGGLSLEMGDPWRFYAKFWRAHGLDPLAEPIPVPEGAARFGDRLSIPLMACNRTANPAEIEVTAKLPTGWTDQTAFSRYPVRAGECYPIQEQITAPASGKPEWQELRWTAVAATQPAGSVTLRVYLGRDGGLPQ
jgi:LmbE family N-acetylglucosaminyl deacetylase